MSKISPSILSLEFFTKTLFIYMFARERFVNPRILKNPPVYKINEGLK